jgi:hypothetical protein
MRNSATHALAASAALILLAACSGANSPAAPTPLGYTPTSAQVAGQAGQIRPAPAAEASVGARFSARKPGGLYVAQQGDYAAYEFALPNKLNDPPKCSITLPNYGADGIGVNAKRILYVPMLTTNTILTFKPSCGAAGPTLNDPSGQPIDVAFDNTNNIVYVDDYSTNHIDVYEGGATSPTRTLSNPAVNTTEGIAVDAQGDVFQSSFGSVTPSIVEYPGGQQTGNKVLPITGLSLPAGLEFDRKGNLIVIDEANGILIYAPPLNGAPKKTITPQGGATYGALDAANRHLYVTDISQHSVDVYAYPSVKYKYTITNGLGRLVSGVAVDPPAPN